MTPDPEGCQGDTWCKQGGCLEGVRWGEREMGEIEDTRRSEWVSGRMRASRSPDCSPSRTSTKVTKVRLPAVKTFTVYTESLCKLQLEYIL